MAADTARRLRPAGLNEVRPRRPEQFDKVAYISSRAGQVSMKSGLEGRNNRKHPVMIYTPTAVSMKSGLEGRNNNGHHAARAARQLVSMKSGLEGRNNAARVRSATASLPWSQ